jgi:2-dehydropantoate 2-reductase
MPYGALLEVPELLDIIHQIIREIFAVAKAKGIRLLYNGPEDYYQTLLEVQIPPTASHRSSMLQDMEKGRLTEIDALNGAIGFYGRQLSVPTPVNDVITAIIKGLQARKS